MAQPIIRTGTAVGVGDAHTGVTGVVVGDIGMVAGEAAGAGEVVGAGTGVGMAAGTVNLILSV